MVGSSFDRDGANACGKHDKRGEHLDRREAVDLKDSTLCTLGGYVLAGWIVTLMLYFDGEVASGTAALIAGAGAGIGTYLGKKAAV